MKELDQLYFPAIFLHEAHAKSKLDGKGVALIRIDDKREACWETVHRKVPQGFLNNVL